MTGTPGPYAPWIPRQAFLIEHPVCPSGRCVFVDPRPVTGAVCPRCGRVPDLVPSEYARDRRAV